MIAKRELQRRIPALLSPVLCVALIGYFAYHLIGGDRGLLAWVRLSQEIHAGNDRLAGLRAERALVDLRVSNLTPDHLDPDLLDERVRSTLNLAGPNELVMMPPPD